MTNRVYYLDEDIIEYFSITAQNRDKVYNYRVKDASGNTVYIGQVYIIQGTTTVNVNVTEVLKMMRPNPSYIIDTITSPVLSTPYFLAQWKVELYDGEAIVIEGDYFTVAMVYRYPNSNLSVPIPIVSEMQDKIYLMTYPNFLPVYPFVRTNNYKFLHNVVTNDTTAHREYLTNYIKSDSLHLSDSAQILVTAQGLNTTRYSLDYLFNGATYQEGTKEAVLTASDMVTVPDKYGVWADAIAEGVTEDQALSFLEQRMPYESAQEMIDSIQSGVTTLIFESDTQDEAQEYYQSANGYFECELDRTYKKEQYPIAKVDMCPARFYVQWIDRFGVVMSKPFTGQDDYTEDVQTVSVQKYVNKERKVYWGVESKWKLRTEWLTDEEYPYYESLFVSPYIILYDSQEDKSYEVLIDDTTYAEKKWDNQHQFFNLEINIRHNQKQHIFN